MTNPQQGSILLNISIIIFLISATSAGYVAWQLRHTNSSILPDYITSQLAQPEDPQTIEDPTQQQNTLMPNITIDSSLTNHRSNLEKQLISPLRLYYATREQRLQAINIDPTEKENFLALVTLTLIKENTPENIEFLYVDTQDEKTDFPAWEPSMFDNTP